MRTLALHCLLISGLLLASACGEDDSKPPEDTGPTAVDADGDGHSSDVDCDDDDPASYLGADEVCDGADNDCDGETDEDDAADASTWYADADGDGYGDPDEPTSACSQPAGASDAASDCDDSDGAINPAATELCDGADNDCDGETDEDDAADASTWYADADGDSYGDAAATTAACAQPSGFTTDAADCDDADASVNPTATELCDGVDNDCDGDTDEDDAADASTWYADTDADGYGDPATTSVACSAPVGSVSDSGDCDDTDATANPGADEYCDGHDDDCDGTVDEPDAVDAATWYADADADGHGDAATPTVACAAPTGFLADDTDCDDADAAINPGAAEICNGVDDDCDSSVDEPDATDAATWYADADADSYGDAFTTTTACSQPSGFTTDDSDCDDSDAAVNPVATELCDGADNDCDGTVDEADAADAATWFGDADGDGFGDVGTTVAACSAPSGTVPDATDCDDSDPSTHPGADEYCDGHDDDCDGTTDEADAVDTTRFYEDADGDGYGNDGSRTNTCALPAGYAVDNTDCDDTDAAINPGADELCDGADNDCDGSTDEADAVDADTWYADADADSYGDASASTTACSQPTGFLADDTDCDDTDAAINPSADEICDGVDNDCNGTVDGFDASDSIVYYEDGDGDGYGDDGSWTQSCSLPTGYAEDNSDCDDTDATVNPAAAETPQDGVDQDCDGSDAPFTVADLVSGDLVITEIMQNPSAVNDSYGEWFEVYNDAGGTVDLEGLYVHDLGSDAFTVSSSLLVDDLDFVVFGKSDDSSVNGGLSVDYAYGSGMTLGNSDDEIHLAESSSKTVVFDSVEYDNGATFPDPNGASMSLCSSAFDTISNDDGARWEEATSGYGDGDLGTPGDDNDLCSTQPYGDGYTAAGRTGTHGADYLLGQQVTLTSGISLEAFGIELFTGTTGIQFALYTDSGGAPGTLVASSDLETITPGVNEVAALGAPVTLSAGDYWLMKVVDDQVYVVESTTVTATTYYLSRTYGLSLPTSYSSSLSYTDDLFAIWLLGY